MASMKGTGTWPGWAEIPAIAAWLAASGVGEFGSLGNSGSASKAAMALAVAWSTTPVTAVTAPA
jgi:hypothetical protein